MTAERGQPGHRNGHKLDDIAQDADEYYNYLKVKQGGASSEDGLHLMDAMHQAAFAVRKRRLTSALEYGIVGFAIVTILGLNAGIGALAGVIVYLYFRYEALREYERGEERYENSKRTLLQSL